MRLTRLTVVFLLSAMCVLTDGNRGDEWKTLIGTATELDSRGNFAEAEVILNRALKAAEAGSGANRSAAVAVTMRQLAIVFTHTDRFLQAERALRSGIRLLEERTEVGESLLAVLRADLITVYVETGQYAKAERECAALDAASQSLTASSGIRTNLHVARGQLFHAKGQYADAYREYSQAVRYAETGEPLKLAAALTDLGAVESEQGHFADAAAHLSRAVELYERRGGVGSPRLLAPLVHLAFVAKMDKRPKDAVAAMERAVAIADAAYGGEGGTFRRILAFYATLLRDAGEKKRAVAVEDRLHGIAVTPNARDHTVDIGELQKRR